MWRHFVRVCSQLLVWCVRRLRQWDERLSQGAFVFSGAVLQLESGSATCSRGVPRWSGVVGDLPAITVESSPGIFEVFGPEEHLGEFVMRCARAHLLAGRDVCYISVAGSSALPGFGVSLANDHAGRLLIAQPADGDEAIDMVVSLAELGLSCIILDADVCMAKQELSTPFGDASVGRSHRHWWWQSVHTLARVAARADIALFVVRSARLTEEGDGSLWWCRGHRALAAVSVLRVGLDANGVALRVERP